MSTIDVKDATGATVTLEKPLAPGRALAAASRPIALSTEDKAAIDALATQITAAAILAKLIAAPATEAKQDTAITGLTSIAALLTTQAGYLDGIETLLGATGSQTTLAAILAKIIAAPATEAKQDTLIAKDFATQTTLAAVLAKIVAAPAIEAKQDIANASLSILDDWDSSDACKMVGSIADDLTTPGAPVMVGGKAVETDGTDPTSVSAEDDVAIFRTDRNRRLLVNEMHPNSWSLFEDHTSAQTTNQLKVAPGTNLSLYITDIVISNGATAGTVKIVEDEGGTPVQKTQTFYLAINGGAAIHYKTPIRLTTNKSLGFTSGTVTTHSIEVHGYVAP